MIADILTGLNEQQVKALQQPAGPVLVLAGPGSGKTRLLVSRIQWSIRQHQLSAEKILAVTFTNKAAAEMKSRLYHLLGPSAEQVTIGTFHSFALGLLRKYHHVAGLDKYFSVCSREYQRHLVSNLCVPYIQNNLEVKVSGLLLAFSNHVIKDRILPPFARERFAEYLSHLQKHQLIDFDHILAKTRELFVEHPDILEQYQFLYPAILVDEFQDIDPVQYDILYLLTRKNQNIFVVADDDQSIYSWRGADPENISRFIRDFGIKPVFLEINYRSGRNILDCANRIITGTERIEPDKLLRVERAAEDTVEVKFFLTDLEEMNFIFQKIKVWNQQGTEYRQIALIYPFHRIGQVAEEFLIKNQVPYQLAEGRSLLDHPQLNKIVLYLRLIRDSNDQIALEELIIAELGSSMFNFIKEQSLRRNLSLRKTISQLYQDTEKSINPDTKFKIKRLVAHIANLFNLKYFYSFSKLLDQVNSITELHDSSFLTRYVNHLESVSEVEKSLGRQGLPLPEAEWTLYHSDKRIGFIACEMISSLFQRPVALYPGVEHSNSSRSRVLLELEPLNLPAGQFHRVPLYKLKQATRCGSLSILFKYLQWHAAQEEKNVLDRYIVLDVETTGKDPVSCAIVEFAAVRVENGQIVSEMNTLVNPEQPISAQAEAVHRIDAGMVKNQRTIRQIWSEIRSFLGDEMIVAHNGFNFDFIILDRIALEIDGQRLPNRRLDTLAIARNLYPDLSNSVDSLMSRLNIKSSIRHRALGDVKILAEIFTRLQQEKSTVSAKLLLESLLDYVALGNFLENTIERNEDLIFFINGARKLITPYSQIVRTFCNKFMTAEEGLASDIRRKLQSLNPFAGNYNSREQLWNKIRSLSRQYDHLAVDDAIAQFLSTLTLNTAQDELENMNAVSLLTYHAAKGLEYDKVIIMGLENKNMPGYHSTREESEDDRPLKKKLEEQRRLLYVGITRARNELILTVVKNRGGWQYEYSPFIQELQQPYSVG
jgi:DNA helicase II / ATP-dependent DNA helicase PcrA